MNLREKVINLIRLMILNQQMIMQRAKAIGEFRNIEIDKIGFQSIRQMRSVFLSMVAITTFKVTLSIQQLSLTLKG